MALEGLAALGLASNILQVIDFSYKLVSGAKEITNSATGVSAQHETFETVSHSLLQLVSDVDGPSSSQIPLEIRTLAAQTRDLAQSFIAELDKLKPKEPKRAWSGFIQAMKEANKSDKLLALNKRLNMLQRSLNSHLLNMMSMIFLTKWISKLIIPRTTVGTSQRDGHGRPETPFANHSRGSTATK